MTTEKKNPPTPPLRDENKLRKANAGDGYSGGKTIDRNKPEKYDPQTSHGILSGLKFRELRQANESRQCAWCPDHKPDLSFRGNELAGEVGEVCNVIKKLERERHGWPGSRDTTEHLAEELADVIISADLVASQCGIDLGAAVIAKFNKTSKQVGISTQLGENAIEYNCPPVCPKCHRAHRGPCKPAGQAC
jgi:NTP pyrophosphatase (non-canonical NTP hydrolase)